MMNTEAVVTPADQIQKLLVRAGEFAACGDVDRAYASIREACCFAEKANILLTLAEETQMAGILREANIYGIGVNLSQAASCADYGNTDGATAFIAAALRCAERTNFRLSEEHELMISEIQNRANIIGMGVNLGIARESATLGDLLTSGAFACKARLIALSLGVPQTLIGNLFPSR